MKTSSAKAKGRALQQWTRDLILDVYPDLTLDDVRSTAMGQQGEDVQLSSAARLKFNYSVECKANARFAIYKVIEQEAASRSSPPLAVIKGNRKAPLVVMYAADFKELLIRLEKAEK